MSDKAPTPNEDPIDPLSADDPARAARMAAWAEIPAPLAVFNGAVPPAPAWFGAALAHAPERSFTDVGGTQIETLTWGERGKPGLLLMHGNGANADWWSFIAPFFAADYRVVAFSWSGMGRSDHRDTYGFELFVDELIAVAETAGAFDAGKPLMVGHSFGGFLMMATVQRAGARFKGAVIADFDEVKNKGVDIAGSAGDSVLAAADGKVVYAGAGLRGEAAALVAELAQQRELARRDESGWRTWWDRCQRRLLRWPSRRSGQGRRPPERAPAMSCRGSLRSVGIPGASRTEGRFHTGHRTSPAGSAP